MRDDRIVECVIMGPETPSSSTWLIFSGGKSIGLASKAPTSTLQNEPRPPTELKTTSLQSVESALGFSAEGLSSCEVQTRLAKYGYNELSEEKTNVLLKFLSYFWGPIPWMIEVAAVLSAIVHHWEDFATILALLLMNAGVGFWEEYQAGDAIATAKAKLALHARVKRDGTWTIISRTFPRRLLLALLLGPILVAMWQSDAPAKFMGSSPGQLQAGIQSAPPLVRGVRSTGPYEFTVPGDSVWTDTALDLHTGDSVHLSATGTLQFPFGQEVGPRGTDTFGVGGQDSALPVRDAAHGAFIVRIGEADTGLTFLAGAEKQIDVRSPGRLYLGIDEYKPGETYGSFKVRVEIKRCSANLASQSDAAVAALIPRRVLANIPRRTSNSQGQPEDLVNLLIFGTEQDVKQTFQAAGWVAVSGTDTGPAMSLDAAQNLSEAAYLVRPLPRLFLFGRTQDYGFARPEDVTVVRARHYLRLWKNPSEVNRQTLWIGAAAHDTGPWWNPRTAEVSYKVDPNVDAERDLVRDTLTSTGLVEHFGYVGFFAEGHVRTQAGSSLQSDGRVLVMTLLHLA